MQLKVVMTCPCPCCAAGPSQEQQLPTQSRDLSETPAGAAWLGTTGSGTVPAKMCCASGSIDGIALGCGTEGILGCEFYYRQSWLTVFSGRWGKALWSLFSASLKSFWLLLSKGSLTPPYPPMAKIQFTRCFFHLKIQKLQDKHRNSWVALGAGGQKSVPDPLNLQTKLLPSEPQYRALWLHSPLHLKIIFLFL